ncbi:hypothetical protein JYU34_013284 [Plutella xylostella]|uniref:Odorant receptor n=1 Tax=Plutella xylostella TaxID=51655 RepID=A0ABQ7Q9G1_PLUXY|nr:hypothetical protein JYU34_013284 [Plutella xylostella]
MVDKQPEMEYQVMKTLLKIWKDKFIHENMSRKDIIKCTLMHGYIIFVLISVFLPIVFEDDIKVMLEILVPVFTLVESLSCYYPFLVYRKEYFAIMHKHKPAYRQLIQTCDGNASSMVRIFRVGLGACVVLVPAYPALKHALQAGPRRVEPPPVLGDASSMVLVFRVGLGACVVLVPAYPALKHALQAGPRRVEPPVAA